MQLYLQFGWGMMGHCRALIEKWRGGVSILSPRDLTAEQLGRLAEELIDLHGTVLLDPQLYVPDGRHDRLTAHPHWPRTPEFWRDPGELSRVIGELIKSNRELDSSHVILPSVLTTRANRAWEDMQSAIQGEAARGGADPAELLATVALTSDVVRNDDQVELVLDAIGHWGVHGVYLVCEHPGDDYLVTDPGWIANCLDLIAGIRLAGKRAIVGYASHQMLIAACAGANAIASGTWMNVRSFPASKFDVPDPEIKQKTTWYYAPQALSEYKIAFLDIAQKIGLLAGLKTPKEYGSTYADTLFSAPQPTLGTFGEQDAFRHYLQCLHRQASGAVRPSFEDTMNAHIAALDAAETLLKSLRKKGVTGQLRDFHDATDAHRAALVVLEGTRGPVLRRKWPSLIT